MRNKAAEHERAAAARAEYYFNRPRRVKRSDKLAAIMWRAFERGGVYVRSRNERRSVS